MVRKDAFDDYVTSAPPLGKLVVSVQHATSTML